MTPDDVRQAWGSTPAQPPLISVITIVLNAEEHLEQTIKSVLGQTYGNIEYIVIDGGSTDRSLEIINQYRSQINYFISEKDEGIADAMNKGASHASGNYLIFLHSDDYFANERSLEDALAFLDEKTDILACRIRFGKQREIYVPKGFGFWTNFKQGIYHQGALCRRQLLEELEGFDTQFRIAMDYDFFLRAYRRSVGIAKAPVILTVMRDNGISSLRDWKNLSFRFKEEKRVHEKNCHSLPMGLLYKIYWLLYLPYRYLSYVTKLRKDRR